ncbi:hypothetical protein OAU50_04750 [Planctomycetota bacterium]|nr:hypothetical protein [Planctomycetota bacterium]
MKKATIFAGLALVLAALAYSYHTKYRPFSETPDYETVAVEVAQTALVNLSTDSVKPIELLAVHSDSGDWPWFINNESFHLHEFLILRDVDHSGHRVLVLMFNRGIAIDPYGIDPETIGPVYRYDGQESKYLLVATNGVRSCVKEGQWPCTNAKIDEVVRKLEG